MRKIFSSFLIFVALLASHQPASAIEGGEEARYHPRIVNIFVYDGSGKYSACSGFLFSPTIVITAAHCQFKPFDKFNKWPESHIYVTKPGRKMSSSPSNIVQAKKIFSYKGYNQIREKGSYNNKDFMVIVTKRPVAKVKWATTITEPELQEMIANEALVTIGGYGHSSEKERSINFDGYKWPRILTVPLASKQYYDLVIENRWDKEFWGPMTDPYEKWGWAVTSKETGATCDGDSGAGVFIERDGQFVYVGLNAWPIESPNCYRKGLWGKYGGLNRIDPIYYHQELLKKAIAYAKGQ